MINTKDMLIEACKALGLVAIFISLVMAPSIYRALKAKPEPKTGNATPFGIKSNKLN